jgi:hypothetical protein
MFAEKKEIVLEKMADTLYNKERRYLDYLNHVVTECEGACIVENGCPLERCKFKH